MTVRVLSTFGAAFGGGILRVATDGLPRLSRMPNISLSFGDLYDRDEIKAMFFGTGVSVAEIGLKCPPYISLRSGIARHIDWLRAIPRYCTLAHKLRRAAQYVDVVYVHTYKELVLAATSGARIVWHCHGLDLVPPFAAHLAGLCRFIVAISDSVAQKLYAIGVSRNRVITVPNAIDVERILTASARPPCAPLPPRRSAAVALVPTASIRANKGIHVLLDAAQKTTNLEIWIAGDTKDPAAREYMQSLIEWTESPALRGRVHFIGFRPDIYGVMLAADFVCVPSICREGFGLAAAEAMALGRTVIVSNKGALGELVQHGETGIVFDPDNPSELPSVLETLIGDPGYAQKLGSHAASAARRDFSYDRWAEAIACVLRNACRNDLLQDGLRSDDCEK